MELTSVKNAREKKRYRDRVSAGLCGRCGISPPEPDRKSCKPCLVNTAAKAAKHMAEKKRPFLEMVLDHYGRKCNCCGETHPKFLTIDHVNNDGNHHRKKVQAHSLPRWIAENQYPSDYQILCWNCNCGKARNGGVCPHKEIQQ